VQSPEPEYRNALRAISARADEVSERLHRFWYSLSDQVVEATVGIDWTPMAGMPGVETRLVPDIFMLEVRGAAGAERTGIQFQQAVTIAPIEGTLCVRRDDTEVEFESYGPGEIVRLAPNEKHSWRCKGDYYGRTVFVTKEFYRPTI
jgi:hypothetical protein